MINNGINMRRYMKKGIIVLMILSILICDNLVFAMDEKCGINSGSNINIQIGESGGYLLGSLQSTKNLYLERKFTTPKGHGFVAERANNLMDGFTEYNFLKYENKVPDINTPNSPDRKIINRSTKKELWIQDKYYSNANNTVNSAFDKETGMYRYMDSQNNPMLLEVPKDQYEKAVEKMAEKIKEGKIKGVTDPNEAQNLVKQGHYTYKQVKNIAKAGNIDSLKYDAVNGAIISLIPMGISFTIDFISAVMNGNSTEEAIKDAGLSCLKTGGVVFGSYVITSQLTKSGLKTALKPTSQAIAKFLGKDVSESLLKLYGVEYTKKNITRKAATLIQNQIIVEGVIIVAMTVPEIYNLVTGRISKEQFAKNLTIAIVSLGAGTAGGLAGAKIGTAILPGAGTIAGAAGGAILGTVAGMGAGILADAGLSKLYEGDASKMYTIVTDKFQELGEDYLISEQEGNEIAESLKKVLTDKNLKDMHASEDREQFAINLIEPLFEEVVSKRKRIEMPTQEMTRAEWKKQLKGVVFIH